MIMASSGEAGPGQARLGQARLDPARLGQGRLGHARQGQSRPGQAKPGQAKTGQAKTGRAQFQYTFSKYKFYNSCTVLSPQTLLRVRRTGIPPPAAAPTPNLVAGGYSTRNTSKPRPGKVYPPQQHQLPLDTFEGIPFPAAAQRPGYTRRCTPNTYAYAHAHAHAHAHASTPIHPPPQQQNDNPKGVYAARWQHQAGYVGVYLRQRSSISAAWT